MDDLDYIEDLEQKLTSLKNENIGLVAHLN
jgi:hypothetical protein